jgi:hypothetical protein
MPITQGDISIIVPVASAEVAAGAPFRVAGRTVARFFIKPALRRSA